MVDKGLINFLQLVIKLLRVHFPVSHKHKPIPTHCVQHSDLESGGGNWFDSSFMSEVNLIFAGSHDIGVHDASLQIINSRE